MLSNYGSHSTTKLRINDVASAHFLFSFAKNIDFGVTPDLFISLNSELISIGCEPDIIDKVIRSLLKVEKHTKLYSNHYTNYQSQVIYTELMTSLSDTKIQLKPSVPTPLLSKIYLAIFNNNLDLISKISEWLDVSYWYADLKENECPTEDCRLRFKRHLGIKTFGIYDELGDGNYIYPLLHPESIYERAVNGVLGFNYCPQLYNNIPYVYASGYQNIQRLRIGAQIEQKRSKNGTLSTIVSQSFKNFLVSLSALNTESNSYTSYLYINLQKRSNAKSSLIPKERDYENERSITLERLESEIPNVMVITLPADNSDFFLKNFDKHHGRGLISGDEKIDFQSCKSLFDELLINVAYNQHDIYLSNVVKNKLFGYRPLDIKNILWSLFRKSVQEILGSEINPIEQRISMSQRQAILFHFFKHTFTDFILNKLKPTFFNISCKDAIDRAGVHNLWNIFCKRIENNISISLQEFEGLLNFPAILVKDRPINNHLNILVNTLGYFYLNLPLEKKTLIPWAAAWIEKHSCYGDLSNAAYSWLFTDNKSLAEFRVLHPDNYTSLYIAVTDGNIDEVESILNSIKGTELPIWDGAAKSDTILLSAARNGHFEIFNMLMRLYSNNPKHLNGMRSQHPSKSGTALNYLFKHLADNDVDDGSIAEDDTETSDYAFESICIYMKSITTLPPRISSFRNYTQIPDEFGKMPLYYLAKIGNVEMLKQLNTYSYTSFGVTWALNDIFDLRDSGIQGVTLMNVAAENGHAYFVLALHDLADGKYTGAELSSSMNEILTTRHRQNRLSLS